MTPSGWILMLLSVGTVTLLLAWCIGRVLFHEPPARVEHMHGLDIDTPDMDEK